MNTHTTWNTRSVPNSRSVLLADKRQIMAYAQVRPHRESFISWVGFNPNVRIQIDMNEYLPLSSFIDWRAILFL